MVNRLQPLFGDLIADTQSAFIPGRLITDNALIAFECLHALKHGLKKSKEFDVYKLDLTKAYDHVDWSFLEGVMKHLGFHCKWVRWVMECVTTVHYSVRFNNRPLEPFHPTRRLRQGDPLSLYLFLFVADALSKLVQHEVDNGRLNELHVSRRGPGISHLLFADDTLMFIEAKEEHAIRVKEILSKFEKGTGQQINPSKRSLMLGTGCDDLNRSKVMEILQVHMVTNEEKYPGLPTP
jgi:hypothetical protein